MTDEIQDSAPIEIITDATDSGEVDDNWDDDEFRNVTGDEAVQPDDLFIWNGDIYRIFDEIDENGRMDHERKYRYGKIWYLKTRGGNFIRTSCFKKVADPLFFKENEDNVIISDFVYDEPALFPGVVSTPPAFHENDKVLVRIDDKWQSIDVLRQNMAGWLVRCLDKGPRLLKKYKPSLLGDDEQVSIMEKYILETYWKITDPKRILCFCNLPAEGKQDKPFACRINLCKFVYHRMRDPEPASSPEIDKSM